MTKVTFNASTSLDGFVAGPDNDVSKVFAWYAAGDTPVTLAGTELSFRVSKASAQVLAEGMGAVGAMVTGRKNFDGANAWGGEPPLGVHHFVVTHNPPKDWVKPGSPFTFVTSGVADAIAEAKARAGGKDVAISSPGIMRQALASGLLDEINLDVTPFLLGKGVPLFGDGLEATLEQVRVVAGLGVTHMKYRVVR
ncbi:MAG: dihydrofolate reductase family protein [Bauldia sp.]